MSEAKLNPFLMNGETLHLQINISSRKSEKGKSVNKYISMCEYWIAQYIETLTPSSFGHKMKVKEKH